MKINKAKMTTIFNFIIKQISKLVKKVIKKKIIIYN